MRRRTRPDDGAAVVEFTLVSVLLLTLFLGVLQVAFALHTRNLLVSAAQEGARYAANADRTPAEGAQRTRQAIAEALGAGLAARMDVQPLPVSAADGVPVVGMQVSGPLPLVLLPAGPVRITVRGHAVEEG
ncbi:MAG TPA: TadE/TadG family type IV pilus assembly protein [Mycobacteriales bacterium]|nr:TadE/TadG family type IV pilus assembly protein [Mycobacteriales bacterium]